MNKPQKHLEQLDPHPQVGDLEFKKKILGGVSVADQLGLRDTDLYIDGDNAEFSSSQNDVDVQGYIEGGGILVRTGLDLPQGQYSSTYRESNKDGQEVSATHTFGGFGNNARSVPDKHLPKHERNAVDPTEKLSELQGHYYKSEGKGYRYDPDSGSSIVWVPEGLKEKDKLGYHNALRANWAKPGIAKERATYPIVIKDEKKAERAAEIVSKKAADKLAGNAHEARDRAIEDLNRVDLG